MPDTSKKKPLYAPYGSDKVNVDEKTGLATPKAYTKTRTMSQDPKSGKSIITVSDSDTKKMLFSKPDVNIDKSKESNRFKADSTGYVNEAKKQAEKINIGKVAGSDEAYKNATAFAGKKKKE